jgi:sugar/nucleoside kinase (ribokinase family)
MAIAGADVVAAGHICLDITPPFTEAGAKAAIVPAGLVFVGPPVISTGGSVANTGLALHRLGIPTRLMGKVGDDLFGNAILELVRRAGPALADGMIVSRGEPTSYTVVLNPPGIDRCFLHCTGTNDTFGPDDLDAARLEGARLFHFGYPPLMRRMRERGGEELASMLQRVKARGLATSLDMAQPDPNSDAGRLDWPALLANVLPHVDVFLPNLEETLFMVDRARLEDLRRSAGAAGVFTKVDRALLRDVADRLLKWGAAAVVLKLGDQGLYLRVTSDRARLDRVGRRLLPAAAWAGREGLVPCFRAKVVSTTGAGDTTVAGFLAALLKGLPPDDAMTLAVAVGACSVEQADATSGVPDWEAVRRRVAAGWERLPSVIA